MKAAILLSLAILAVGGWWIFKGADIDLPVFHAKEDPVTQMKRIASEFPSESTFKGYTHRFYDVGYDVRKSESLVNPTIGMLYYKDQSLDMECVFHWKEDHWVFVKLMNRENGLDFTDWGGGLEMMSGSNARPFFEKYGWRGAIPDPEVVAQRASIATPRPVVIATPMPRRTPTTQDQALDIARKYGSPK